MRRILRHGLLLLAIVTAAGCAVATDSGGGGGGGGAGGGGVDAGPTFVADARPATPRPDARPATPRPDAAANRPDAAINQPDAQTIPDASPPVDSFYEADAEPGSVVIKSASVGVPNTNGYNVTSNVWLGWRFEVTATLITKRVGFFTQGSSGTAFATIVRLDDATDVPDSIDLSTSDVLVAPVTFALPSTIGDVAVPVSVTLQPGWYAIVFGTSAFGASSSENTLAARGNDMLPGQQNPFLMVQSTAKVLEGSTDGMRFYVEGMPE